MNMSVNIGSSEDFKLSRALLVYGKSSYDGFPYRHPFVTVHEVVHENDGARLAEGRLVTSQMLLEIVSALGGSAPVELLPEHVIVRTANCIVWWAAAQRRTLFFRDEEAENQETESVAKKLNGKLYPHPPLLFKARLSKLWVRALLENERPTAKSVLCVAPYWNCYETGVVCTGSMKIPREQSVSCIDAWEEGFFRSEFTHAAGVRQHTRYRGGLLPMWQSLQGKKTFPQRYLIRVKQTMAEFVNDDDHRYQR